MSGDRHERSIVMVRGALCYRHGEFDPAWYGCPACRVDASAAEDAAVTVVADAPDNGDVDPPNRDLASLPAAEDVSLLELVRWLLDEYEREETEHGFPFNFALRDAHRALRAALARLDGGAAEGDAGYHPGSDEGVNHTPLAARHGAKPTGKHATGGAAGSTPAKEGGARHPSSESSSGAAEEDA